MGLVLLPPALLSIMQGLANARHDVADLRGHLISTTRAAAAPTENTLASAREIAIALSNLPDIRNMQPVCSADLAGVMRGVPFLTNITRLDRTGRVVCAGLPRSIGSRIADRRLWRSVATGFDLVVSGMSETQTLRRPFILGLLPMRNSSGRFEGAVGIAIDVRWLNEVLKSSPLPSGSVMAVFDKDGNTIAASNANVARETFAHLMPNEYARTIVHTRRDDKGRDWTYATAPLLDHNVYVGFAMPDTKLFGRAYSAATLDFVVPFVMIMLTWAAIWIVTDRQLTRWIIYLRRISAVYQSGHYALRPALAGAPSEFKLLGDALAQMAVSIRERDRSLRDAITQKTILIKEIHHRVKNNLQIVMSLLSLQAKRLRDQAAQHALADARTRINALALVHRILYEIDDQATVDAKRLLEQLAEQTGEGFGGERSDVRVAVDIAPCNIPSEMAVPLSLFTVEAMTNAFKHAFPAGRRGTIRVVLKSTEGDMLCLSVEDDGVGFDSHDEAASIGARLIRTFGQQVGGISGIRSSSGHGAKVEIVFPNPNSEAAAA